MSSTMRLFLNDNRISTAVKLKSGVILQVYPKKTTFQDEVAWQKHWETAMKPKITLKLGEPENVAPASPAPLSIRIPRARRFKKTYPASELIYNALASMPKPEDWKIIQKKNFTVTLPAGTYYIGDLCYALASEIYTNIYGGTGYSSGIYENKNTGQTFAVANTAWGDGLFMGSDGKEFAVDAAIIGICSQSLMGKRGKGGNMYTFETPVKCSFICGQFDFDWYTGWNSNRLSINTAE